MPPDEQRSSAFADASPERTMTSVGRNTVIVDVVCKIDGWRPLHLDRRLPPLIRSAIASAGHSGPCALTISLASDQSVRALNHRFRSKNAPTNVLSFPATASSRTDAGTPYLGDIVLAYETTAAESSSQSIPLLDHACHLAVHGTLHLLGYDHQADNTAEIMERLESLIMTVAGFPDPYGSGQRSRSATVAPSIRHE